MLGVPNKYTLMQEPHKAPTHGLRSIPNACSIPSPLQVLNLVYFFLIYILKKEGGEEKLTCKTYSLVVAHITEPAIGTPREVRTGAERLPASQSSFNVDVCHGEGNLTTGLSSSPSPDSSIYSVQLPLVPGSHHTAACPGGGSGSTYLLIACSSPVVLPIQKSKVRKQIILTLVGSHPTSRSWPPS